MILVRDGNKTVITMYNDYKGDVKDFAMVVPVPVVLKKDDIHVVDPSIFQRLNDYSAPSMVEYWDQNPCMVYEEDEKRYSANDMYVPLSNHVSGLDRAKNRSVKIEAT